MHAEIGPLCETHRLGLRIVDVDSDPELSERFNAKVPVLALGDEIICCHFLDISALEDALSERADEQLNP